MNPFKFALLLLIVRLCLIRNLFDSMQIFKGDILIYSDNPGADANENSYSFYEDGLLITENEKILYAGSAENTPFPINGLPVTSFPGKIITAGFVDTHIHYPQINMIASFGEQLLEWLERYAFPAEKKFADSSYAKIMADEFLRELHRNGTTTALVFSTVHSTSADALFTEAQKYNMALLTGKVLMDRNAPEWLTDTPETGYKESKILIDKWHKKGRLRYAVTPRFAITSSTEQLQLAGRILKEHHDVYMQTHLSENKKEIESVARLFPESSGYLDVYDRMGLATDHSVFAHCVHLTNNEYAVMKARNSAISFCPCSNMFLGSGLFNLNKARKHDVKLGLGTDVGGGNSFSILQNLNEAYKVAQLRNQKLHPIQAFYYATLGGAKALNLDHQIGTLKKDYYADFIVLNPGATNLMRLRLKNASTLTDKLFILMMMGDDRCIDAAFIAGHKVK